MVENYKIINNKRENYVVILMVVVKLKNLIKSKKVKNLIKNMINRMVSIKKGY